jgi:hypothetical protein
MSKGLKLTLMTVAVAMMAAQVMAMAPVIGDIPSPVVGDAENTTPANYFVFPDAFNLASYVSDDTSPAAAIKWTYETAGTPKYKINGVPPLAAGDDPNVPPAGKVVNTQVLGGEHNPDSNVATLTIRNIHLTPNVDVQGADPMGSNLPETEAQLVTLWASDGEQADSADVWFYTHEGADTFGNPNWTNVVTHDFEGSVEGWTYAGTNCTSSNSGGTAICIDAPAAGSNMGTWAGPTGMVDLVKNNIYRIRAKMQGSQASGGSTNNVPFWDVTINNLRVEGGNFIGLNLYGFNYMVLDNAGRANAVVSTSGGMDFEFWWCPSPISLASWNVATDGSTAGPFAPAVGNNKNSFMEFRVLDDNSNPGITADAKSGSLCITNLIIDRAEISALSQPVNKLPKTTLSSSNSNWANGSGTVNYTGTYPSGGGCLLTPSSSGATSGIGQVQTGDGNINFGNMSTLADDYPAAMAPAKLYLITVGIQVPTANDATNCQDVFWVGADTPSNELICLTWVSSNQNKCAMPTTTNQEYKALFYSNFGTAAGNPAELKALRPRFMVGNNAGLGGSIVNSGSIQVNTFQVDEVSANTN